MRLPTERNRFYPCLFVLAEMDPAFSWHTVHEEEEERSFSLKMKHWKILLNASKFFLLLNIQALEQSAKETLWNLCSWAYAKPEQPVLGDPAWAGRVD